MSIPTDDEIKRMRNHSAPHYAQDIYNLLEERDTLIALINTPKIDDFLNGTKLEAAHQEQRWGTNDRESNTPEDWFWLIGYLAGKALHAAIAGDTKKHLHHCISTAAVLANWHKHSLNKSSSKPNTTVPT